MKLLRQLCTNILLITLCVPSAFAMSVTHTKATQSISLYFGGGTVQTVIPADPTTGQILHAYFIEAQKAYPQVYYGVFTEKNAYQRALEMGLITGQVSENTMTEKELGQFFYRAKVLHKYAPDIRFFHRGLVLFPTEITQEIFPSLKEVDEIIARYDVYFRNKSMRAETRSELERNLNLFKDLRVVLAKPKPVVPTPAPAPTPAPVNTNGVKLDVPYHKQESSLSCEIASLRSVLLYYGKDISEKDLFTTLGISEPYTKTSDGVWGDPDKAYVGNIKGSQANYSGYGVHWAPIARVGNAYLDSFESFSGKDVPFILDQLNKGAPVIIWGVTSARGGKIALTWKTPEGKEINTWNGEHTFLVYGYKGPSDNPQEFYIHDPYWGTQTWSKDKLISMWKVYNNSGVSRITK